MPEQPEQDSRFFTALKLHESLQKALQKLEFTTPTPVQREMLPVAMSGRDVQASAETGSGKTLAYLLPVLQKMLLEAAPKTATRCLILLPTRELADQINKHCQALAAFTQIKSMTLFGGASFKEQKALIRKNPEILIATPGRLLEHLQNKSVDLSDLEFLILDEADRMLDMGFREDVFAIINQCKKERQSFLLSATLNHEGIARIAREVLSKPGIVDMGSHRSKHGSIEQQIILADDYSHKDRLTLGLLNSETYVRALVFTNTKVHANQLANKLRYHEQEAACLHGDMTQDERQQVMLSYREGKIKILVATDLAARGLDVKNIDLVINYSMARSGDEYVHRIGRTGRAGESGLAISLISPQEWNLMDSIERYLKLEFKTRTIKGNEGKFKGPVKKQKEKKGKDKVKGKNKDKDKGKLIPKAKQRHRNKKNIGKRRTSEAAPQSAGPEGLSPLRRKP